MNLTKEEFQSLDRMRDRITKMQTNVAERAYHKNDQDDDQTDAIIASLKKIRDLIDSQKQYCEDFIPEKHKLINTIANENNRIKL